MPAEKANLAVFQTNPLMKTDLKTPLEVDRELLAAYDRVAGILGIPTARYVKSYLKALLSDLGSDPVQHIANELFYESYRSRQLAEAAAERFEAFAISEKLEGNSAAVTVTTEVVEHQRGFWRVKVHYLTKAGWRLIASDLWGEDDDEDAADSWKGDSK
jgi:hypothetical protein